ncbi:MAG: metallophosphoesterase family protein [Anaerolineales bacterium]
MPSKVAFLSDIHGNSPALQAVLDDIQREKCAEVFMLGDIINGVDPHGCVEMLRTWSNANNVRLSCIRGNAEAYLTTPDLEALSNRKEDWNQDMIDLIRWFESHLSGPDLDWIRSFPDTIRWNNAYLVHDSPLDRLAVQAQPDPEIRPEHREWFYHGPGILPGMAEQEWQKLLEYMEKEHLFQVFCGHTHVPFYKEMDNRLICNVGSVGAPLDGDPRSSWVMLDIDASGNQTISIRRLVYDVSLILQRIEQTPDYPEFKMPGFREAYKKWFLTGVHWRAYIPDNRS